MVENFERNVINIDNISWIYSLASIHSSRFIKRLKTIRLEVR